MTEHPLMTLCQYRYDALDRWIASTLSTQAPIQRFYQKHRLATEIKGSAYTCVFQHRNQLLAQQDSDKTPSRLLATDQQRSVLASINVQQYNAQRYTPYGHPGVQSGLDSLLGFNGERPDPITGHYLLGNGHRAYNPILMRFNSSDRFSPFDEGGINAYAYCSGDPVNWQDPTGNIGIRILRVALPTVAVVQTENRSLLQQARNAFKLGYKSLVPSTTVSAIKSPGRQAIQEAASSSNLTTPFSRALNTVNNNLASHGVPLDMAAGEHYVSLLKGVDAGDFSNTGAHVKAANYWLFNGFGAERAVGVTFNLGGALLAGVHDAKAMKTGQAIREKF